MESGVEVVMDRKPKIDNEYFENLFAELCLGPRNQRCRNRRFKRRFALSTVYHPPFETGEDEEKGRRTISAPAIAHNHAYTCVNGTNEDSEQHLQPSHTMINATWNDNDENLDFQCGKRIQVGGPILSRLSSTGIARQFRSFVGRDDDIKEDRTRNILRDQLRRKESQNLMNIVRGSELRYK